MKRRWTEIGILLLVFVFLYGDEPAGEATVNASSVPVVQYLGSKQPVYFLKLGQLVSTGKTAPGYTEVSFQGQKGWVEAKNLIATPKPFSTLKSGVLLCDKIYKVIDKHYFFYYFDEKLYKACAEDQSVVMTNNVGSINEIYPSSKGEVLLFEGINTNHNQINSFALYYLKNGKAISIGSFEDEKVEVFSADFSPDDKYLVMGIRSGKQKGIGVYATADAKMIALVWGVQSISWYKNNLIMNDEKRFWSYDLESQISNYDIGYKESRLLTNISAGWLDEGSVDSCVAGNSLLIQTPKGVLTFDLETRAVKKAEFSTLFINDAATMFYDGDKGAVIALKTKKPIPEIAGKGSRFKFLQFLNNSILCQASVQKIETLYYFDPVNKITYRYKAIDKPDAVSGDGVLCEVLEDKRFKAVIIESPLAQMFYFITLKE